MLLEPVLEVQFEDRPKSLYRVQFGTVGRQEQEFDVQLPGHVFDAHRSVGPVVVHHQYDPLIVGSDHPTQKLEEFDDLHLIGGPGKHKDPAG